MKRQAEIIRKTRETDIKLQLNADGTGRADIQTGIGFFDHMLSSLACHSKFDLNIKAAGDLHIDSHHTIEDTGLVLGEALLAVAGEKAGIARFGTAYCPMDEALVRGVLDLSGRPEFHFSNASAAQDDLRGDAYMDFFKAAAIAGKITLHLDVLKGVNRHHTLEACFKALAKALASAFVCTGNDDIASTKGML